VDIWRLIADIGEPALRGMIDIGAVGARLNWRPQRKCHHLGFLAYTRAKS